MQVMLSNSIQVLILGEPDAYKFHINGAVWRDDEKARVRKWWASDDVVSPVPIPRTDNLSDTTFRDNLREALTKARGVVFTKHQKDLKKSVKLPERSSNLIVKAGQVREKSRSRRGL